MENLAKNAFSSFCFHWKIFKQTPLKIQEYFVSRPFLQTDYFRSYSCLKLTYALKCIKVVALIKIMTAEKICAPPH